MAQRPALGKGLASLFPGTAVPPPIPSTPSAATAQSGMGAVAAGPAATVQQAEASNRIPGISMANVEDIQTNPFQPRREFDPEALNELKQSIQANGIIQPLVVRKTPQGQFVLIAGERRLRACKMAGLKQVPVVIRRSTDREALELALVENIQRQNLNCIDEALAYFQLVQDFALTQEEVAQRVGKDRATVANHLRLLRLPEPVIIDLKNGVLSFGHGKALLSLEDPELRMRARNEIVEKHLSVRDAEAVIDRLKAEVLGEKPDFTGSTQNAPGKLSAMKSRLLSVATELTRHWSARVELKGTERRGKIVIHYGSRQELDRILEAMQNKTV
jgi:ParB family transcriptional regulator, chromosome partitioning protein